MKAFVIGLILITLPALAACHGHDDGHGHGDDHHHGSANAAGRPQALKLTPRFSGLLRKEMREIDAGMARLFTALVQARASEAKREAEKIKASYILKQALSKKEMQELGALLPAEFSKMDGDFHRRAGEIGKAMGKRDFAGAMKHYTRMSEGCVACHSRFARERFPGFKSK